MQPGGAGTAGQHAQVEINLDTVNPSGAKFYAVGVGFKASSGSNNTGTFGTFFSGPSREEVLDAAERIRSAVSRARLTHQGHVFATRDIQTDV